MPENDRPISILSLLSKLLERHIYEIISNHLHIHYPISDQKSALKVCQKDWHSDYDILLNSANVPQEESIGALPVIFHRSRTLGVS